MLHTVSVRVVTASRTARAVSRDGIVRTRIGPERVRSTDSDHRRLVARRVNPAVNLVAVRVLTVISGSRDDHEAGVNQSAGRAADRIILVRIKRVCAQADVHYANAVLVFVKRVGGADRLGWIDWT